MGSSVTAKRRAFPSRVQRRAGPTARAWQYRAEPRRVNSRLTHSRQPNVGRGTDAAVAGSADGGMIAICRSSATAIAMPCGRSDYR